MTAVEWLVDQMRQRKEQELTLSFYDLEMFAEKAKAMEKDQHQETFKQSRSANIFKENMSPAWESWEQYYKETFKSE